VLRCDQRCPGSKLWVRITAEDVARLDGSADVTELPTVTELMETTGLQRDALWAAVQQGNYLAYRTPRGQGQWEWRLKSSTPTESQVTSFAIHSDRQEEQQYE
jgi:hypothetical protein